MNDQKRNGVTILLLIITMVIQPVILSYAMVGMDHGRHYSVDNVHYQVEHHHLKHARNILTADRQTDNNTGGVLDNCCFSTACGPAAVSVAVVTPEITNFIFPLPLNSSAEGVYLPVRFKPPQILPGHQA